MVKAANEKDAIARTEAALYSSGRPLKIDEIIRASGTESRIKTKQILDDLVKKTKSAFKAIEIAILPDGSYVFCALPLTFLAIDSCVPCIGSFGYLSISYFLRMRRGCLLPPVSLLVARFSTHFFTSRVCTGAIYR